MSPVPSEEAPGPRKDLPVDETSPTYVEPFTQLDLGRPVVIEGFTDLRALHRGGQGVVYEALQSSTKRRVAIKILSGGAYASEAARRRFQREVEIVAQLRHPNIVSIFDSGRTPEGLLYYVMELIDGAPLDRHVRESKLSLDEVLRLYLQVLDAVAFAHEKGVIHRDLKPSNILVDGEGRPKVVDFGLARELLGNADSVASVTGQVLGTFAYMSPEQVRGRAESIDARTDVYSLGMILYAICTGKSPYPVDSQIMEVLRHITDTPPELPARAWSSETGLSVRTFPDRAAAVRCPIDQDLETMLLKAIAKDPERRYASARAMAEDIERYLAGHPIAAKRDGLARRAVVRIRKHPVALVGAVLLLAVSGFFLVPLLSPRSTLDRATELQERAAAPGNAFSEGRSPAPESRIRFLAGEAEYAEVRQQLSETLNTRIAAGEVDSLSTESLRIVQDAVRELRAALDADPGNEALQELLLANYERELRLMRKICNPITGA